MNTIPTIILLFVLIVISTVILRACKCSDRRSESFIRMVRHTKWRLVKFLPGGKIRDIIKINGAISNNKFIGETANGIPVTFNYTDKTRIKFDDDDIGYLARYVNSRTIKWDYTSMLTGDPVTVRLGLLADV
jgi:hypothetical protein